MPCSTFTCQKQGCLHAHRTASRATPIISSTPETAISTPTLTISNLAYGTSLLLFPYISANIFTATTSSLAPAPARSACPKYEPSCGACVLENFSHQHSHSLQASTRDDNSLSVGLHYWKILFSCLTATANFSPIEMEGIRCVLLDIGMCIRPQRHGLSCKLQDAAVSGFCALDIAALRATFASSL